MTDRCIIYSVYFLFPFQIFSIHVFFPDTLPGLGSGSSHRSRDSQIFSLSTSSEVFPNHLRDKISPAFPASAWGLPPTWIWLKYLSFQYPKNQFKELGIGLPRLTPPWFTLHHTPMACPVGDGSMGALPRVYKGLRPGHEERAVFFIAVFWGGDLAFHLQDQFTLGNSTRVNASYDIAADVTRAHNKVELNGVVIMSFLFLYYIFLAFLVSISPSFSFLVFAFFRLFVHFCL